MLWLKPRWLWLGICRSVSTILLDFDRGGMASSEIDCTLVTRTESAKEPLGFRDETTVERPPHISCFFIADRSADPTRRSPAAGVPAFQCRKSVKPGRLRGLPQWETSVSPVCGRGSRGRLSEAITRLTACGLKTETMLPTMPKKPRLLMWLQCHIYSSAAWLPESSECSILLNLTF